MGYSLVGLNFDIVDHRHPGLGEGAHMQARAKTIAAMGCRSGSRLTEMRRDQLLP